MSNAIEIELSGYDATCLLSFVWASMQELEETKELTKVRDAYYEMLHQVASKMTIEQFDRIKIEHEINQILGKEPE